MKKTIIAATVAAAAVLPVAVQAHARTVPSGLTNKRLDVVERKLDAKAIGYKTVGGGLFGIVLKADWGVCATQPTTGRPIHGPVELIVGHYTCGA